MILEIAIGVLLGGIGILFVLNVLGVFGRKRAPHEPWKI